MLPVTERLELRPFTTGDTTFIVRLLNEPSFIEHIGDRGVRNEEDAQRYLTNGPFAMYERFGFGLWGVVLRSSNTLIGMCGVLQRDTLEFPDLGFAFLPEYWASGYAREAARAVMKYAREELHLQRILAITSPDNRPSIRLLDKLGFRFEAMIRMPGYQGDTRLFIHDP